MTQAAAKPLFDQIGGEPAMQAAVEDFYRRVLADERIAHFFDDVDMEAQMAKQKAFLTFACGGPNQYTGRDMTSAHAALVERGLNDSHVDAVAENLNATLRSLGVDDDLVKQVIALADSVRDAVLGR